MKKKDKIKLLEQELQHLKDNILVGDKLVQEIIEQIKSVDRYDVDVCYQSADFDLIKDGDYIKSDDLEEIIKELEQLNK